ncbi:MAG: c-type cytochrome [Anaerolineales bacterium]|nr:c-type cytochrome [Anaerolineales bacterium]
MSTGNTTAMREDYSSYIKIGLALALALLLGVSLYWWSDAARLQAVAERLQIARVQRGFDIYAAQCASCHGAQGEGGVGWRLNDRALLKNTQDEVFYSVIRSGVPNTQMPAWSVAYGGPLTDEDIRDVVAFLRSWEATAPEVQPTQRVADPQQGAALFASTCAICHGKDGRGGEGDIPAINNPQRLRALDDAWYRNVIAYGRPAKGMPTWGTVLSPEQMDDLVALIGAWRAGQAVVPAFSGQELLDQALYAISQDDLESAASSVSEARRVVTGAGNEMLANAQAQLRAGDALGTQKTLELLRESWPLGDPANGAISYSANCAVCHGPQGGGGVGVALVNNAFVQSQNNAVLVQFLLEGRAGTAMAGFAGRLPESELADIVAFLRLWQP